MAITDHFGPSPSSVCNAILTELSRFSIKDGDPLVGCVRTIKRFAGNEFTPDQVDLQLSSGVPAFLVAYVGGPFDGGRMSGRIFDQVMRFTILCAAGQFRSQDQRLAGETPTHNPGVEDLLDWATYYGVRGAMGVNGLANVKPGQHRWIRIEPGKYLAAFDLEGTRRVDLWDDTPTTTLEALGIVHSPTDPADLWEQDNETPKSEWPATTDGGVADPL